MMVEDVLPISAGAYTPIPRAPFAVANTIASGQKLAGNTPLYCANRQVFAILQGRGRMPGPKPLCRQCAT